MLSMELGHGDFTASNGWLDSWQKRHNVKLAVLCVESAEVPRYVFDHWSMRLPGLTAVYAPSDI